MRNEGDDLSSVSKKHKKRKNTEVSDLRGEEGNVGLADEGRPKNKMKTEVLVDSSKCIPDVDIGMDTDRSFKKVKKVKRERSLSRTYVNAQANVDFGVDMDENSRKEKKKKKKKTMKEDNIGSLDVSEKGCVGFCANVVKSSKEEKKKKTTTNKKDTSSIDANAQNEGGNLKVKVGNMGGLDMELLRKGAEHARKEAHVKKKKNKNEPENENKVNDNETHHELTKKADYVDNMKKKNVKEDLSEGILCDEKLRSNYVNAINCGDDSQLVDDNKIELVRKKKKKKNKPEKGEDVEFAGAIFDADSIGNQIEIVQCVEKKKRKKENRDDQGVGYLDEQSEKSIHDGSIKDHKKTRDIGSKKRKEKSRGCNIEGDANACTIKSNDQIVTSEISTQGKKSKKVRFSDNVEVIYFPEDISKGKEKKHKDESNLSKGKKNDDGLIRGKRFSKEEDEMIQNAVQKFIKDHELGDEGLKMILNCKHFPELKDCWKVIGKALPWRPYLSVYYRTHVLFERSEARKWTPEEIELLKKLHVKHGSDWKTLSNELGKHRLHVKDAWRRIKFSNLKKGNWSQEEYKNLFNLVNVDLSLKASAEKKKKHGMLRDNICWSEISEHLSTRTHAGCCEKWYHQLTSSMVAKGHWANVDDYRLLLELTDLDASCEEDVDWNSLLKHRSGDVCRKRWNEMVHHINNHGAKPFAEKVEILSQRYCPSLLEATESYDNRPPVDC